MSDAKLRELERRYRASGNAADRGTYLNHWRRHHEEGVLFVYRTPYDDPSCKRIRKLKGASVLDWFQRAFRGASRWKPSPEPYLPYDEHGSNWELRTCGGHVYGFSSFLQKARELNLPTPGSWQELAAFLQEHLYVEGRSPVVDEETVRVLTDDDELELAYFVLPLSYLDLYPERLEFLTRKSWRLPTASSRESTFQPPVELPEVRPAGQGEGAVYVVDLSIVDGCNLSDLSADQAARVLPGLRVPDLPSYLRTQEPREEDDWPQLLRGLRLALGTKERTLKHAVKRCLEVGTGRLANVSNSPSYTEARLELGKQWPALSAQPTSPDDLARSKSACSSHLLQLSRWEDWCFNQWFVFDDLWASANPNLASSLLHYATNWDPLGGED